MNALPDDVITPDDPPTTKEGWRRFVDYQPEPPTTFTTEQLLALGRRQRAAHDEARREYHAELPLVHTPTIRQVLGTGRLLVQLNRRQVSARRGLILSGASGTGKTTALTQLGRTHERAVRRRHPDSLHRLPVAYVTVPPAATAKMLAVEFARFYGLEFSARANMPDIVNAVCATAANTGVELVSVDEIHNLNLATRAGAEVSDQLKYFAERLPATFVYAGIDVEAEGLFAGVRGRQIAGRFTLIASIPFAYGTTEQRTAWRSLIATLEALLRLHQHTPGTLVALGEYLYRRSSGMIGSLSQLIRGAAILAIEDGTEQITRELIDLVPVDFAAEGRPANRTPSAQTPGGQDRRRDRLMHARLPIAVAPAHHETAASYIARLANLHGIPFPELWRQVSRPRHPASTTMVIAADRLAAVTGIPETRLARALIEIRHPEPDWQAFRHEPQHGCPRCTARHPGGPVRQLFPHHRYVCTRHRIWIGPPDLTDQPYPALDQLPEIVAAQRAHLRLLHRLGHAATYDAVLTGFLICGHRWDQQPDPATDLDARLAWRTRIDTLMPPGTEQTTFSTSRLFAATYPEAVKIAALVGSLHWRRLAAGNPDGQRRFAAEIGRRLGQPDYQPKVTKDPIAHWIDDDCWRPPSLPPTTYRTLPGFGNPTITKPNQHSLDRHHRSAHWFARNRRGGRVILYHRHVDSVLARDWSRKMEQFVGTVEASAEARTFSDLNGQEETPDSAADYIRPTAMESDYLAAAVNPAVWPVQSPPPVRRTSPPTAPGESSAPTDH